MSSLSNFFLQLAAEGITVIMYVGIIVAGIFAGMFLRKFKEHRA